MIIMFKIIVKSYTYNSLIHTSNTLGFVAYQPLYFFILTGTRTQSKKRKLLTNDKNNKRKK